MPFERKGEWKIAPNDPRRADGIVHRYCPPEHVDSEMDRLFRIYNDEVVPRQYPVEVEAAVLGLCFVTGLAIMVAASLAFLVVVVLGQAALCWPTGCQVDDSACVLG